MKWGLMIGLWLTLLAFFAVACFFLMTKGEKKELGVFATWILLLGVFISVNIHTSPLDPRFAEWVLHYFQK